MRILHSDDILAPQALAVETELLDDERLGLDLLYHDIEPFTDAPRFDRQPVLCLVEASLFFRSQMYSGTPLPSATVFRRTLLESAGGMREELDFLCDWDFFARLIVAQHRRNRFVGRLTRGYIGWRKHGDSTTGRLWHRHFLEHEKFMEELRRDTHVTESIIGDHHARALFFARAVHYRYLRLAADVSRMRVRTLLTSLPLILRCLFSPTLLRGGSLLHAHLATVFLWIAAQGRRVLSRHGPDNAESKLPARDRMAEQAGGLVPLVDGHLEINALLGAPTAHAGTVYLFTGYNNLTNLWPVRRLIAAASRMAVHDINSNAFFEPVLHQFLKCTAVGAQVEFPLTDNRHLTWFGFKALLDRVFPRQFSLSTQTKESPSRHVLHYERRSPVHAAYSEPHTGWTFGMLTTGQRPANVGRFIDSIERHCAEPYEIVLVSPVALPEFERRRFVRVLQFSERDELGWITRKKNLICESANYSDILVCHDRFWLDDSFPSSMAAWGYSYGLAAVRVHLPDGRRGLDWAVVSSENRVWSSGGLLDYRAYSKYAYVPGGATLIRKAFWRDFPWNENLFWNEHEDVELSRRVQRAGAPIALAAGALEAAEDRWVRENPPIPYSEQEELLYGRPVGEQRMRFLSAPLERIKRMLYPR